MNSRWNTGVSAVVTCVVIGLAVWWSGDGLPGRATSVVQDRGRSDDAATSPPARSIKDGVLYDDVWEITEGVWALTDRTFPKFSNPARSSNGLLEEGGRRALWVFGAPGMYGGFPTRVTSHTAEPSQPAWCEDVVEAPLRIERGSFYFMGFEDYSDAFEIGSGDFRVRLCVAGLDDPLADPEAEGSDGTSTSRFLFQVWQAPWAPGEIVKVGSEYARHAHAEVARAHEATS